MKQISRNTKLSITFLMMASVMIISCKKTLDINHDPNNPSLETGNTTIVFPNAVMGVAGITGGKMAIVGGILGEYVTQSAFASQYKTIDQYDIKSTDLNSEYTTLYSYGLKNLQYVIDKAAASQDWNFYLMANVMKSYAVSFLVDLYDQVPYSEALQGIKNITPKFDDGYTIYESLISGLDTALSKDFNARTVTDLKGSGQEKADLVFLGDIEKWKEFANTLELKLYLRMVNAKPQEAMAGIKSLYDRHAVFLDDNAAVSSFINIPGNSNPMFEQNIRQLNTNDNLRASKTFVSYLSSNGDPRIVDYFGVNPTPLNQGDYSNNSDEAKKATVFIEKATDPVVFISKAESYFLQAEARERYFNSDGAKALYDNGVLAAFSAYNKDGSAFIASGGKYAYPSGTMQQNIEAIIVQKWVSNVYGDHFIEGWFDRNRTGFPKTSPVYSDNPNYIPGQFVVSKNSVLPPGEFPKRIVFPDIERSTNPNTPAEVPITTPVWWGL